MRHRVVGQELASCPIASEDRATESVSSQPDFQPTAEKAPEGFELYRFVLGPLENNVYALVCQRDNSCAVIDPGLESEGLLPWLKKRALKAKLVLNTHGHFDHVAGNALLVRETGAAFHFPEGDLELLRAVRQQGEFWGFDVEPPPEPTSLLRGGENIAFCGASVHVVATPGHSPGGVSFFIGNICFVGDTIFASGVGRTDLPGGSDAALMKSIKKKLLPLPDDTLLYPGHGPVTSVGEERRNNPFIM
jgi:glyoxylase-like metal-dependent hydrolase (beta-lactamase superfamily II)